MDQKSQPFSEVVWNKRTYEDLTISSLCNVRQLLSLSGQPYIWDMTTYFLKAVLRKNSACEELNRYYMISHANSTLPRRRWRLIFLSLESRQHKERQC